MHNEKLASKYMHFFERSFCMNHPYRPIHHILDLQLCLHHLHWSLQPLHPQFSVLSSIVGYKLHVISLTGDVFNGTILIVIWFTEKLCITYKMKCFSIGNCSLLSLELRVFSTIYYCSSLLMEHMPRPRQSFKLYGNCIMVNRGLIFHA